MLKKREIAREEKPKTEFDLNQAIQKLDKIEREIEYKKREVDKVQIDMDNVLGQLKKDFGIKDIIGLEKVKKQIEGELQELTGKISKEYEGLMDLLNGRGIKLCEE